MILGGIILALASLTAGEFMCQRYGRCVKDIISFRHLLVHIRSSIEIYKMPLPEIYSSFYDENFEKTGILSEIKNNGMSVFLTGQLPWFNSEIEDIKTIIRTLGQGSAEEGIGVLNLYIEKISEREKHETGELADKKKLSRTLSGLAGLSLIIMFI